MRVRAIDVWLAVLLASACNRGVVAVLSIEVSGPRDARTDAIAVTTALHSGQSGVATFHHEDGRSFPLDPARRVDLIFREHQTGPATIEVLAIDQTGAALRDCRAVDVIDGEVTHVAVTLERAGVGCSRSRDAGAPDGPPPDVSVAVADAPLADALQVRPDARPPDARPPDARRPPDGPPPRWRLVNSGVTADLQSVWGTSASDVWAVGSAGTIIHFDGVTWTRVASGSLANLFAVRGSGPAEVWATGNASILRWNGGAWSDARRDNGLIPYALWGSARDDFWAVGVSGTMQHFNGAAWSDVAPLAAITLYGAWGSGPSDLWAGGNGILQHWNGSDWRSFGSGSAWVIYALWGHATDDVWAVGYAGTLEHWNGLGWAPVASPASQSSLFGIWGASASDVWAVGPGVVLHWNGSDWRIVTVPTAEILHAVWGSGPGDVWVVGERGTLLRRS